ncbi:hypothetical protein FD04_GL000820 [Secundilactobacillus odoratitofui DSM 19909 = JCM 15043]|uniref:Amino acid permease n=1 Tax=Secundilactobacillus odoratitofui DSM 19909 = JCM 15043 TaxID=1423776 RepID=A0A0R1LQX1_9LACO|nr:APC family permease [Secundilactobacillus odoratitofui]KRK97848.1 hypothetical protein FD04_GL000820 [Secundilactobacillus odoratitofui DSM 19909 = JCM 15043]
MATKTVKKSVGTIGLISLGAGGTIGSGWIYTNSQFFSEYGAGGEIFGLMLAMFVAVLASLSFAELATLFIRSGGEVVFGYVAFGKRGALFAAWTLMGGYLSALGFYVTASSLLIAQLFPAIATGPSYQFAGVQVYYLELGLGILITLIIFTITYLGAKLTGQIQTIMMVGLVILGVTLMVVGFSRGSAHNFWPAFSSKQQPLPAIIRFVLPAMTFLTGWESVATMAEEAKMPAKKIGIIVIASIVVAATYYIGVLLSSAWVYPWQKTANLNMGTIDAFKAAGFPILGTVAFTIAVLGLLTSFLNLFSASSRLIFSLARGHMLPKPLAKLHPKYGTPTNALWLVLVLALGIGWLGKGALVYFLDMGGFLIALAWAFSAWCLIRVRRNYPTMIGGFRNRRLIWPTIGGLAALAIAAITVIPGTPVSLVWPYEYIILGAWTILGLAGYLWSRHHPVTADELLGEQIMADLEKHNRHTKDATPENN